MRRGAYRSNRPKVPSFATETPCYHPLMAKIAILVEKIYEDLELQYPRLRLKEAGHQVDVIGPKAGETYIGKHGYPQKAEKSAADVKASDYDLVVIPGGTSPDHMRRSGDMI